MKRVLSVVCVMAVMILPVIGSQAFAQCTNLLVNPGFEDGGGSYNGWFTFPPAPDGPQISTAATDNIIRSGLAAAKIFGVFTNCPDFPQFDVSGFGQAFTPTAGKVYELSGYSFVSSGDPIPGTDTCTKNRLIAQIAFFDAASAGNVISRNEVVVGDGNSTLDQWNEFFVSTVAPSGALRVEALFLFLQPGCDTGSVFIDDVSFCEVTETPGSNMLVNPSFDTALSGWTAFANVYHDTRVFATRTPIGSAKLYGPFTTPGDVSGMYQTFPAVEGAEYTFSTYALTTCEEDPIQGSNDNYATAKLVFHDAVGAEIAFAETTIVDSTSPVGTWTKHSVVGTAPAGSDSVLAYILFIQPTTFEGAVWVDDLSLVEDPPTGIAGSALLGVGLRQNVPNPFNPTTTIRYNIAERGHVTLKIYNAAGELVRTLVDEVQSPGHGEFSEIWNGTNDKGQRVSSGVYFYRLTAKSLTQTKKMVLLK